MGLEENIRRVKERIARAAERAGRPPDTVTLVAVAKTVGAPLIQEAFQAGLRHFAENRVQEAEGKREQLSALPLTWHMVGHLQTNKAKTALSIFDIIHSVDSVRLAEALSRHTPSTLRQAQGSALQPKGSAGSGHSQRALPIMLQVNLSGEVTKSGFAREELGPALARIRSLPGLEVQGLMTIAPVVADPEEVRPLFRLLRQLRDSLGLRHLSMGMTDDFEVAVEEGATMVRIGQAIFGQRAA
ncbi:MAG: YggS family pyridoxal phosphate-dependent enzyme [Chloroflexota bacterium]|nr:YggS family pyridoxal phosphate-dependent enzyme [Chloroflexota bacterium]